MQIEFIINIMMKILSVLMLMTVIFGCAHNHVRGSVVMIHRQGEADVCLGAGEVKIGDQVSIFKSVCKSQQALGRRTGDVPRCEKIRVSSGTIKQVLDEHYSTMEVKDGAPVEVGYIIESQ